MWLASSTDAIWIHSTGSTMPGFEFSTNDCHYFRQDSMTAEQRQALEAMVLVESDHLCLEDGWDDYLLLVYAADGSSTGYTTDGCESEVMLSTEAMSSFPVEGASPCPGN